MTWGTTYYVATEFLPPNHPLMAAALRSLPIGVLMTAWLRQLPQGVWWWRILILGGLNIVWGYALIWFLIGDWVKQRAYGVFNHEQPVYITYGLRKLHQWFSHPHSRKTN